MLLDIVMQTWDRRCIVKPHASIAVAAFYAFQPLEELERLRLEVLALCRGFEAKGILLLASEGVNATLAVADDRLSQLIAGLRVVMGGADFNVRLSRAQAPPFKRLRVRIKTEIVTLGRPNVDPNRRTGRYIEPEQWNDLITHPDVVVIDARNAYEIGFGTFQGAIDPGTRAFGQFPDWVRRNLDPRRHRRIAMFCTGGIRCEKASSFMLGEGFEDVVQLRGGILGYLEAIPEAQSLWRGGCFVFDDRVALGHGLTPLGMRLCLSCNSVVAPEATLADGYEEGVSCPRCVGLLSDQRKASARERQRQMERARRGDAC